MKVKAVLRFYAELRKKRASRGAAGDRELAERMRLPGWGQEGGAIVQGDEPSAVHRGGDRAANILILDEPFSGFDPVNAVILRERVLELKRQGTADMLFDALHNPVAEKLCDFHFHDPQSPEGARRHAQASSKTTAATWCGCGWRPERCLAGEPARGGEVTDFGNFREPHHCRVAIAQALLAAALLGGDTCRRIARPSFRTSCALPHRIVAGSSERRNVTVNSPSSPPANTAPAVNTALKAFLVSVLMLPLMLSGTFFAQKMTPEDRDQSIKRVAVLDRTARRAQCYSRCWKARRRSGI